MYSALQWIRSSIITFTLFALFALHVSVTAQSLNVLHLDPPILRPGNPQPLRIVGNKLPSDASLWTSFPAHVRTLAHDESGITFEVHAEASLHGFASVRLIHPSGCSAPHLLLIDTSLPPLLEVPTRHQVPTRPFKWISERTFQGSIADSRSLWFEIELQADTPVWFESMAHRLGSKLDPLFRLWDMNGREWTSADDTPGFYYDAVLAWTPPVSGTYLLELRDTRFAGGDDHQFILRQHQVAPIPTLYIPFTQRYRSPSFPEDPRPSTYNLPLPTNKTGGAENPQELCIPSRLEGVFYSSQAGAPTHRFTFMMESDKTLRFSAATRSIGSSAEVMLRLTDTEGRRLAESNPSSNDDGTLEHSVAANTPVTLEIHELGNARGTTCYYVIDVRESHQSFTLTMDQHTLEIVPGSSWEAKVQVDRKGYNGPIQLIIPGLPEGCSMEGDTLAEGAKEGTLKITVPSDFEGSKRAIVTGLYGEAKEGETPLRVVATNASAWRKRWPEMLLPPPGMNGTLFLW